MNYFSNLQHVSISLQSAQHLSERGISTKAVEQVILQGNTIHKQQLKFLFLPKSKIHKVEKSVQEAARNLVVIMNLDKTEVVTCYKHEKAVHRIKKKNKRLARR